jgi:hypothetical protein
MLLSTRSSRFLLSLFCILICTTSAVSQTDAGAQTPTWLHLSLEQRTRCEHLTNPFRLNASGTEKHFPLRTRLKLEVGEENRPVRFLLELQDSRVFYEEEKLYSARSNINEIDFLQAQLQFQPCDFPSGDMKSQFTAGRFTMDLGKRRLVARNNMRNTTNAFDGFSWILTGDKQWTLYTFLSHPVVIDSYSLDTSGRRYFWGAYFESTHFPKFLLDVYYIGLHDVENSENRKRLTTLGGRVYRIPTSGDVDYEIESAVQFGKNGIEDNAAWLFHGELGFSFKTSWRPRLSLYYDFASGDCDPEDGKSNRFDTLYGARSFEYPSTGIYGPIYRSNIETPGLGMELTPIEKLRITMSYRELRLASSRDAWVGSGLQDLTGKSGKSLGQNFETRIRWQTNSHLTVESGYARFFKGSYLELVPDSPHAADSNFFYISVETKATFLP